MRHYAADACDPWTWPAAIELKSVTKAFRQEEAKMSQRIDVTSSPPAALKAMHGLEAAVDHSGLEHSLLYLLKMRASQINGCAYCLDMHSKDALAEGETDQRLFLLNAWREAPFYTARERAA